MASRPWQRRFQSTYDAILRIARASRGAHRTDRPDPIHVEAPVTDVVDACRVIRARPSMARSLHSSELPTHQRSSARMTKTILILGISATFASIACSSESTGSGDSNITGGDT